MREVLAPALDSHEPLDVTPPGREVLVAERPVDGDALARIRLEVEIAPPVDATPPHDRPPAHLAAANPVEGLVLGERVRIVEIVDEDLARILIAGARVPLDGLVALEALAVAHATVAFLVRGHVLDIVDRRIDRPARLEHDRAQSVFGELFR